MYKLYLRPVSLFSNKNAKIVNNEFVEFLYSYSIKKEFIDPTLFEMSHLFDKQNSYQKEELEAVENKLFVVQVNMDKLEKKFYVKEEVPEETFEKLITGLRKEKTDLMDTMKLCKPSIWNLKEYFSSAFTFSTKLPMV